MLNTHLNNRPTHGRMAEQERRMDGINLHDVARFSLPRPRETHRTTGRARGILLMAAIIAATLAVLLLLDHAGIHLPTSDDMLTVPLLD